MATVLHSCCWMRRRATALQALVLAASIAIIPVTFFTSSVLFYPYAGIVMQVVHLSVLGMQIVMQFSDPVMEELAEKRRYGFVPAKYVSDSKSHVIEDERCKICQIHCPRGTKHCRKCNACVDGFDHHCTWLNMCIGSKNYKLFISFVAMVVVDCVITTLWHITLLAVYFSDKDGTIKMSSAFVLGPWVRGNIYVWMVLTFCCVCLGVVMTMATANLLYFHYKLWQNGQSTYHYIIQQRKRGLRGHPDSSTDSRTVSSQRHLVTHSGSRRNDVHDLPPGMPTIMENASERSSTSQILDPRHLPPLQGGAHPNTPTGQISLHP